MQIEFFFDCSSPWTYLAFLKIQVLAAEFNADIVWRPILVGGIFNAVNPGVEYKKRLEVDPPAKITYYLKDLSDWIRAEGVTLKFPPPGHPVNSVKAMRACLVLQTEGLLIPWAHAVFQAYFGAGLDISDDTVLNQLCASLNIVSAWLFSRISDPQTKQQLHDNVDEAISRGAFGTPTMYLDRVDMYFGVDRLQLLKLAMERKGRYRD